MQVNKYKLLIPVSPDSINQVIQYGKREGDIVAMKKKWERLAIAFITDAQAEGELPARFLGKISVFFKLYFALARNRDSDNYEAMCKGIIDALVVKRLVPDDNASIIDDNGRRLRIDIERPRVEVIIRERFKDDELVGLETYQPEDVERIEINYAAFGTLKTEPVADQDDGPDSREV